MVRYGKLLKPEFAFRVSRFYGFIYIGFWTYGITIPFRRGTIDVFQAQKNYQKVVNNKCIVCGEELPLNNLRQVAKYHKKCRKWRHHPEKYVKS